MQKWEYLSLFVEYHVSSDGYYYSAFSPKLGMVLDSENRASMRDIEDYIDKLGAQGWEMLAVMRDAHMKGDPTIYYFKRPDERRSFPRE